MNRRQFLQGVASVPALLLIPSFLPAQLPSTRKLAISELIGGTWSIGGVVFPWNATPEEVSAALGTSFHLKN